MSSPLRNEVLALKFTKFFFFLIVVSTLKIFTKPTQKQRLKPRECQASAMLKKLSARNTNIAPDNNHPSRLSDRLQCFVWCFTTTQASTSSSNTKSFCLVHFFSFSVVVDVAEVVVFGACWAHFNYETWQIFLHGSFTSLCGVVSVSRWWCGEYLMLEWGD